MKKPTLTFDTSCVISLLHLPGDSTEQNELAALEQLREWAGTSRIEISISEKSRTEALLNLEKAKQNDPNNQLRFDKWQETLNILKDYPTVSSRWIIGMSRIGIDTVFGSDLEGEVHQEMALALFGASPGHLKEGDSFDLAILFEHYIHGSDLFVTRDKKNNILKMKTELMANWNVVAREPIEAVAFLSRLI
jgi:hypothetical protein